MGISWYLYLLFLALYVFTKHFLNKTQNFPPSPFPCLPIIGHFYLLKKTLHRTLSQISNRNGDIVLLQFGSRPVLVVSSPSAAEECFARNDIIFANRPGLLIGKHLGYNHTSLVLASYGENWRNLRGIASIEILSATRLQMLASIRNDEVKSLIRKFLDHQNQSVEMRTAFFELTLNVMMGMLAGKRYYGENLEDVEEARRFGEIHVETFKLIAKINIGDFLPWVKSIDFEKKLIECRNKRDKFMQDLIEQQRRRMMNNCDATRKKTMIEVFLSLQESEPEYYSDQIIRALVLVLLLAGTDTTVNAMEWAFSLLLNHPEVLKKAKAEIDNRVGYHRLIDESDLAQLPYLHCIINETLRMYPSAPLLLPHESSNECLLGGFHIPRGTTLLVNMWAIQNDPKIWVDPTRFFPERLEGLEGTRDGFRLMPFGSGRRGCPGENLGLRMVGLTLGSLIQCFEWSRIGKELVNMREGAGFTMRKAQPLEAKCTPCPTMLHFSNLIRVGHLTLR
ncbi:cytochrome P450 81E8-like [Durio zibethinus]|uniref:Cytochrome P450 81E8-like n=1 Tax=Durio zibethinus TaxID=66656 RepID=A0A6P6AMB5_DURZI|nr:cytochrome P450 81E8-like [Durio zibethinus]